MHEPIRYEGPIWEGTRPSEELHQLLGLEDRILELRHGEAGWSCVLGVPHHAGPGVDQIAKSRPEGGRVADENAVIYALAAYSALAEADLPCRLVVALHATDHDPNKDGESAYCQALFAEPAAELLVECHGAGFGAPHPLEITAGRNPNSQPLRFAGHLAQALDTDGWVASQIEPGLREGRRVDRRGDPGAESDLKFPALRTASLWEAGQRGMQALHLEATPRFRTYGVQGLALTPDGARLGGALATAILKTLRP